MQVEYLRPQKAKLVEDQLDRRRRQLALLLRRGGERNNTQSPPDGNEKLPKMVPSKTTIDSFAAVLGDWAICLSCANDRMDHRLLLLVRVGPFVCW